MEAPGGAYESDPRRPPFRVERVCDNGCQNKRKLECPAPARVSVHLLDAWVLPDIQAKMGQPMDIATFLRDFKRAEQDVEGAEAEMTAFLAYAQAAVLGDHYAREVDRRREAIRAAQERLFELEEQRHPAGALVYDPERWDELPIMQQRDAARAVIERVTITRAGGGRGRWLPLENRVAIAWR